MLKTALASDAGLELTLKVMLWKAGWELNGFFPLPDVLPSYTQAETFIFAENFPLM